MDAVAILKQMKYARIIKAYAEQFGVSYFASMKLFYNSMTFQLLEDGIADLHCRSDLYLVDELRLEEVKKQKLLSI
ncbi:MAG: DUF3791 domain-containing protein [Bacteroidales bacterium]|nr:DUF3791 domain-containing protein [Bacteroidales bacterium]